MTVRPIVQLVQVAQSSADFSPEAAVAFMREELCELRDAEQLGPLELQWAVEHLIGSGVSLPDVLGVVFDFAELEWLTELEADIDAGFDADLLAALARQIGIDPHTGKRPTPKTSHSLRDSLPPNSRVHRRDASATGCEGARQKPLRGWQR